MSLTSSSLCPPLCLVQDCRFIDKVALYEADRARLIARMASQSNEWLDLHSTSSATPPYALPTANPQSVALAQRLDIGTEFQTFVLSAATGKNANLIPSVRYGY